MKTSTDKQRTLEMACISQLAYVAYKQGNDIVSDILKTGYPSFFQPYQTIEFISAPRPLSDTNELVCCGLLPGLFHSKREDKMVEIIRHL